MCVVVVTVECGGGGGASDGGCSRHVGGAIVVEILTAFHPRSWWFGSRRFHNGAER